jgi:hypothetical protein
MRSVCLFLILSVAILSVILLRDDSSVVGREAQSQHSDSVESASLDATLSLAEKAIRRTQGIRIHPGLPNWVKTHALLVYGSGNPTDDMSRNCLKDLTDSLLGKGPNDVSASAFTLRHDKPWPKHGQEKYVEEDHQDQFLYLLSAAGVSLEEPLYVGGQRFTVRDLLTNSLAETRTTYDLSWTVAAYARYLDPGGGWQNKFGQPMSLGRLLKALLDNGSAVCGGTHRLGAIAKVLSRPDWKEDPEVAALWPVLTREAAEAAEQLKKNQAKDGSLRMSDGRLPQSSLRHPVARDVHYTGHCLEWLSLALSEEQLHEQWVIHAADFLAQNVANVSTLADAVEIKGSERVYNYGGICHAVTGLRRWSERVRSPGKATEPRD